MGYWKQLISDVWGQTTSIIGRYATTRTNVAAWTYSTVRALILVGLLSFPITVNASDYTDVSTISTMDDDDEPLHLLSLEEGLAGTSVTKIITDCNGKVWIAASYGINVFNGKVLSTYDISVCGKTGNTVSDICEGQDGAIYATTRDGIICLKLGDTQFRSVAEDIPNAKCLFADGGLLYIGSQDGLFVFDGLNTRAIPFSTSRVKLDRAIRLITKSSDGIIHFFSRFAIHRYHPKTGKTETIRINNYLPEKAAYGQFAVQGDNIYVGTKNNGLFCYDQRTKKIEHIGGIGNVITSVHNCGNGCICVGTDGSGAYLLDTRTNTVTEHFGKDETGRHHIPTNAVYYYRRDKNGVDWLGFSRYGMAYSYYSADIFKPFRYGTFSTRGLDVRSFCIHGEEVLIGTFQGFYYIDKKRGIIRQFSPSMIGNAHIITQITWFKGQYYIGSYDGGLLVFNPQTLTVVPQRIAPTLSTSNISVLKVSPKKHDLWIGCSDGLYVWDGINVAKHFTEQNSRIVGGTITSILFDRKGNPWITSRDGLCALVASPSGWQETNYPKEFFNQHALKGLTGHDGQLLFHNDNDVYFTDDAMTHFGILPLMESLRGERCTGILDDGKGFYWIATENGLFMQKYSLDFLMHFGYGEGLKGSIINSMAQDDTRLLWIGTSNGLVCVSPEGIERWKKDTRFHVSLYNVSVDDKPMTAAWENEVNDRKSLSLAWNFIADVLIFNPMLVDYAKPYGRVYEYRLDDEEAWRVVTGGDAITIGRLFLGSHQLTIRLAGAQGTEQTYTLHVYPSVLFIVECILLLLAAVLWWTWHRYRKTTKALLTERDSIEGALIELEQTTQAEEAKADKYQRVRMEGKECADIVQRMRKCIEAERLYTNPELKRTDIAEKIGVSPSKLSQVFSLYLKENYYDFINLYRLEEFKRLVNGDDRKRYTILALSEKCGFKKTSFFSTFRKVEGMTPTEYLKSHKIDMKL